MFTDVTKIELFDGRKRHQVMVVNDEAMLAWSRLKLTKNRNRDSVHLWGCINYRGFVSTELIEGTLNADAYISILDRKVASKIQSQQVREKWTYQPDNALAHTAKRVSITTIPLELINSFSRLFTNTFECVAPRQVKEYYRSEDIKVLYWPAQSPHLNPIKNIQAILKANVQKECKSRTVNVFKDEIQRHCANKQMKLYCLRVIRSMPHRIQAYIKARSGPKTYYERSRIISIRFSFQFFHFSVALCSWAPPEPRKGRFGCTTVPQRLMLMP